MRDHKAIAKKSAATKLAKYGEDWFKEIGKLGGQSHDGKKSRDTIVKKYGKDYYVEIGKKGRKDSKNESKEEKGSKS